MKWRIMADLISFADIGLYADVFNYINSEMIKKVFTIHPEENLNVYIS